MGRVDHGRDDIEVRREELELLSNTEIIRIPQHLTEHIRGDSDALLPHTVVERERKRTNHLSLFLFPIPSRIANLMESRSFRREPNVVVVHLVKPNRCGFMGEINRVLRHLGRSGIEPRVPETVVPHRTAGKLERLRAM